MPTYYLSDLVRWAKSEGGKCTSKDFYGLDKPHSWMCSEGHSFDLKPVFVRQGAWCPKCNQIKKKSEKGLEKMRKYAEKHGGKCLSNHYVNRDTILTWECKNKHKFKESRSNITVRRNFCRECASEQIREKNLKKVKEIAEKKGGKCLSEKYVSREDMMKFQCEKGHIWETSYQSIYYDKSWCVRCVTNRRITMDEVEKWAKDRGWVCLSKKVKGKYDRLFWKCENGHKFEMSLSSFRRGSPCAECEKTSNREKALKLMQKWAKERGGKCISTEYINNEQKLEWECKNGHRSFYSRDFFKQKNKDTWCEQCNKIEKKKEKLKELSNYAKKKGGACLSDEYINLDTPLKFKCKKGHVWETTPHNITFSSVWCPKCALNAKLDIETMHEMAAAKNGKCLSKKYVNANTDLEWQCEKGHVWKSKPANIRSGHWCIKCFYEKTKTKSL